MLVNVHTFSFHSRVYKVLISLRDHRMGHSHEQQVKEPELKLVRLIAMGDIEAIKKRSKLPSKSMTNNCVMQIIIIFP